MIRKTLIGLLMFLTFGLAPQGTVYYVSPNGSDSNPGTQAQPWKTVQRCLDQVQPGDTCEVFAGTYSEALVLKTSGEPDARIALVGDGAIINSGANKSLVTSGEIGYYTLDGLDFVTTGKGVSNTDASVHFAYGFWGDGHTKERGNDGFILRNCYVEGAVYFYGSDNLVENCELNGNNRWMNGLIERSQPSERNVFRNNVIHNYTQRGGWSLQMTQDTLWQDNHVYKNGQMGIDCDGAGYPVSGCDIIDNKIHDITGEGAGVLMENAFTSMVEGNTIYNIVSGISIINYGPDISNGQEYRTTPIESDFRDNVIYNASNGLLCKGAPGGEFIGNQIRDTSQSPGYWGAIALAQFSGYFCTDWTITDNTVEDSAKYSVWVDSDMDRLTGLEMDRNIYDPFAALWFNRSTGAAEQLSFTRWQAKGYDTNSVIGKQTPTPTVTSTPRPTFTNTPTLTPTFTPTPIPGIEIYWDAEAGMYMIYCDQCILIQEKR